MGVERGRTGGADSGRACDVDNREACRVWCGGQNGIRITHVQKRERDTHTLIRAR